jgi:hypothetical protein
MLDDISREFKGLFTHKVSLYGWYRDRYHVEMNPLPGNKHEFTLILFHGLEDCGIYLY